MNLTDDRARALLLPVRDLLTTWILAAPDPQERTDRFLRLYKDIISAYRLGQLLTEATGTVILAGQRPPDLTYISSFLLAGGPRWRLRAVLFYLVVPALAEAGYRAPGDHTQLPEPDDEPEPAQATHPAGN